MRNRRAALGTALGLLACLLTGAVLAAAQRHGEIQQTQGTVMISSLSGQYVAALRGTPLIEDSLIFTLDASTALLRFDNGCVYKMEPNEMIVIDGSDPCACVMVPAQVGGGGVPFGADVVRGSVVGLAVVAAAIATASAESSNRTQQRPLLSP